MHGTVTIRTQRDKINSSNLNRTNLSTEWMNMMEINYHLFNADITPFACETAAKTGFPVYFCSFLFKPSCALPTLTCATKCAF